MSDPTQTSPTGFKREIGLFSSINILVGIIIGSGVFYLGSYILLNVQMSMGYALLAWTIGGVVSLLGGLCLAELGAMNPKAGGTYVYLSEAYHPVVGFTNEWTSILVSGAGSNAGLAIAFAMAISSLSPMSPVSVKLIAVIAIIVLSAVNFVGVKFGALVQNVFTVSKVIPIVLILFWGIFAGKETPNLSLAVPAGTNFGGVVMMIGLAVVISLWAYEGWANLNSVAEEIKNPQKNIPRAIIIALASITVIYVAFNFAIYRILPADAIKSFIDGGQMYLGTESARSIWGVAGVTLIAATMIISMFGSLNGCIMAFPREYYAVSKDGHFIPAYSWLHTKFGTPYVSIISQCVISIILALFNTLGQITALVVFASILYKMLTVFSVFIYRKKQPDAPRPYKVPLTYVTVTVAGLSMLALLVNVFIGDPRTATIGLAVPLSGVIVYYLFFNNKTVLSYRVVAKLAFILAIIGFFMPVASNMNAFQLVEYVNTSTSIFIIGLYLFSITGLVIGIVLLMKKNIPILVDWIITIYCLGIGLGLLSQIKLESQSGAFIIGLGFVVALILQIISAVKKEA